MKSLERIGWAALGAAALPFIVATIAAFAGPRDWRLDLLANLRPHYLFALTLLAAGFAVGRRWAWAGVCAAAAVVNLALVAPVFLPHARTPTADPGRAVSVMALNVKVNAVDTEELVDYLRGSDADLVFLFAAPAPLAGALAEADISHHVLVSRQPLTPLQIILLARDPAVMTTVHWMREDDGRAAAVEAVVDAGARRIRVLGTHPQSPMTPARAAQRDRQLARLAGWAGRQSDPVLIVGDLNATPWSHAFRTFLADADMINSLGSVVGIQSSWPSPWHWLGLPIDHAVHSRDLVTVERYLGPSFGSDHRSLHVSVAPNRR